MRTRKGQAVLFLTAMMLVVAGAAAILLGQPEIIAQTEAAGEEVAVTPVDTTTEAVDTPSDEASGASGTDTSQEVQNADRLDAIDGQLRAGKIWEAGFALLDVLHGLPDTAKAIDDAVPPVQMLTFAMCSLMKDDVLLAFLKEAFDSSKYPIDDLALASFHLEFLDYAVGRNMSFTSAEDLKPWIKGLAASDSPIIRAGALFLITNGHMEIKGEDANARRDELIDAMNRLAEECPDSRVTRETFGGLLRACATKEFAHLEVLDLALNGPQWNDAMRGLIAADPVAQAVQGVLDSQKEVQGAARQQGTVQAAIEASGNAAETEVRAWFVRAVSPSVIHESNANSTFKSDVKTALTGHVQADAAQKSGTTDATSLDTALAQLTLLTTAATQAAATQAEAEDASALIEDLLDQQRDAEPVDLNLFDEIPRTVSFYAHSLVNRGDYRGAATVFQRLIAAYPDTELARRSQATIDNLAGLY